MPIATWEEIETAPDYDTLAGMYWQPIPAATPDQRARLHRMLARMNEFRPPQRRDYLPAAALPKEAPEPPLATDQAATPSPPIPAPPCPPPPQPKPRKKPAPQPPAKADLDMFKSLFGR